jgi:hypothetical protein
MVYEFPWWTSQSWHMTVLNDWIGDSSHRLVQHHSKCNMYLWAHSWLWSAMQSVHWRCSTLQWQPIMPLCVQHLCSWKTHLILQLPVTPVAHLPLLKPVQLMTSQPGATHVTVSKSESPLGFSPSAAVTSQFAVIRTDIDICLFSNIHSTCGCVSTHSLVILRRK